MFSRSTNAPKSAFVPKLALQSTQSAAPSRQTSEVMAKSYICPCSSCYGEDKKRSRRSIESHLEKDQDFLKTIPPRTESAIFVRSCIHRTIILLSQFYGGPVQRNMVSDVDRYLPEALRGASLSLCDNLILFINYF